MPKTFLIDTSRCTACRGCQIACKEWNLLPANKTKQYAWGSHQNPQDLNPNNYKLVRFSEHLTPDNLVRWNFFPDQCRHCQVPPCKDMADMIVEGAVLQDEKTGAVIFTDKTKKISALDFQGIKDACPYDIPRRDPVTGLMAKCDMCNDRVKNGLLPACVKVCPTGAMNFGERDEMLQLADKRLAKLKKTYSNAMLADPSDVNVIYLLIDKPENYYTNVIAGNSKTISRKKLLAGLAKPFQQAFAGLQKT